MKLILFGAGFFGEKAYTLFGDENIYCFCDNAVQSDDEKTVHGKRVISFDTFMKIYQQYIIVICLKFDFSLEVSRQLDDAGVENYLVYGMFSDCKKTSDEWKMLFREKAAVEQMYRESYKYLAGKMRTQLQYLKRHVDITTLKPATGELRKRQYRLLDQAAEFFAFVKELDIMPFLVYGNLIGAVRHQGFVPWDDDLDFGLVRNDYEKLLHFARENCVVLTKCDEVWAEYNGEMIKHSELSKRFPDKYLFYLRPDFIQLAKCTAGHGNYYVMDLWAFDFYQNEYDIRDYKKWIEKVNAEVKNIESIREKVQFIRRERESNPMVSVEMTDHFFPGIDNSGGYPGDGAMKEFDSWIPTRDVFPLKQVKYENTSFWAPNNMEAMLSYEYKDYKDFPEDIGFLTHDADGGEAE